MRLHENIDFTTLTWVKPELDETLKQARDALQAYVEDGQDPAQLRSCASLLHQVQGTLRMVELYGAAMVAEEMEQLSKALVGDTVANRDEAYGVLMQGIVQLPDYLERLQSGHRDIPIVLLPVLNQLRAARGEKGLAESVLFSPDLSRPLPASAQGPAEPLPVDQLRRRAEALRGLFQGALLAWLKDDNSANTIRDLTDVCEQLVPITSAEPARRLFWVAAGTLDALAKNAFPVSKPLKQALAKVEREIKRLAEGGDAAFRTDPPIELTKNLLYFVAHEGSDDGRIGEIREVFGLTDNVPSEAELAHARGSLTGHNRALLETVAGAIKEDLLRVKDALDLHLRTPGSSPAELIAQVEALDRVADTLGMLGLGVPRRVVQEQRTAIHDVTTGQRKNDEATLLDIAGALLYVEASLDDQVERLGQGEAESAATPTSAMPMPGTESRKLLEVLVKEAITNFAQARQCFVAFVETHWDHAQLTDVPRLLEEVSGALRILDLQAPSEYLTAVRRFTESELLRRHRVPNGQQMDRLADALASLEYFLEALRDRRPNREQILDVARQSLESLGYWPLPEQDAADALVAAKPPVEAAPSAAAPTTPKALEPAAVDVAPATPAPEIEAPVVAALSEITEAPSVETPAFEAPVLPIAAAVAAVPVAAALAAAPIAAAPVSGMVPTGGLPRIPGFDGASNEEIDDEIREVFLEEFEEEIGNLDQLLPPWRNKPDSAELLRPIRRVFHTLKGSGRLVGAKTLGEFSWKVESMLNKVLDNSRPATPAVVSLIEQAFTNLPLLRAALQGETVHADLAGIEAVAERISAGEEAFYSPSPLAAVSADIPVGGLADVAPVAEHAPVAAVSEPHPAAVAEPAHFDRAAIASADTVSDATETPAFAIDPVLFEILKPEVDGHLETIDAWLAECAARGPQPVTDPLLRSVHTMNGAFAMTEVSVITDVTAPLEGFLKRSLAQHRVPGADGVALVTDTAQAIRQTIIALERPRAALPDFPELAARAQALRDQLPDSMLPSVGFHSDADYGTTTMPTAVVMEAPDVSGIPDFAAAAPTHVEEVHAEAAHLDAVPVEHAQAEHEHAEAAHFEEMQIEEAHAETPHVEETHVEETHAAPMHFEELTLDDAHLEPVHAEDAGVDALHLEDLHGEPATAHELALEEHPAEAFEFVEATPEPELAAHGEGHAEMPAAEHAEEQAEQHVHAAADAPEPELLSLDDFLTAEAGESAFALHETAPEAEAAPHADGDFAFAHETPAAHADAPTPEAAAEPEPALAVPTGAPADDALAAMIAAYSAEAPVLASTAPAAAEISVDVPVESIDHAAEVLPVAELHGDHDLEHHDFEHIEMVDHDAAAEHVDFAHTDLVDHEAADHAAVHAAPAAAGADAYYGMSLEELEALTSPESATHAAEGSAAHGDDASAHATHEEPEIFFADEPEPEVAAPAPAPVAEVTTVSRPQVPVAHDPADPEDDLDTSDLDVELLDIFLEESNDILDHSDGMLAGLRENTRDRELVVGLQRDLHTLKGGARMAGIYAVGDLGHAMESLLEAVAEGRQQLDDRGVVVLERGFDRLHGMVMRIGDRKMIALPAGLIAQVEALARGQSLDTLTEAAAPSPAVETKLDVQARAAGVVAAPVSTAPQPLEAEVPEAAAVSEFAPVAFSAVSALKPLSAPVQGLGEDEEGASVRAPQEQVRIRADLLDRLVNYAGEVAIYRARLEQQLGAFRSNLGELNQTTTRLREQLRRLDIETEAQISARYAREQDEKEEHFDPLELDRFTNQQQLSRGLAESANDLVNLQGVLDDLTRQYETLLLQQSRVSSDLQEGLMRTRMVPFDALVPRLRRVLRQAASDTGKQVQLKVDGASGEMDRNVLERMTAPLEHMLRNSMAHGLELPEERRKAKKPEEGVVRIAVQREGSEVVLKVTDDGRGLNKDAIRRKAIEKGLIAADAVLSEDATFALILEGGFSTAETVTRLSGRGVGMDVVYSEIRQLGGTLQIKSTEGKGSEFIIRLPFTLAVTQAVFVKIGETSFAVPIASVQGVGRISRADLEAQLATDKPVFRYAGEDYAIHDLGHLIGHAPAKAQESLQMPLLLARSGDLRAAISIDQVLGSREIVVKPVGPQVNSVPGIFGATIMGDGRVVVILDVAPLVRRQAAIVRDSTPVVAVAPVAAHRVPVVMVVDDSITMRKVTGRVLERHNMEVLTAKDGVDAVEKMAERVPDLVLLDIEMPRMDGYEVAQNMRSDPRLKDVPIIMITSRTGDKHRQRAMDIGVNRYLGKPYQEPELMRNVYEMLGLEPVNG